MKNRDTQYRVVCDATSVMIKNIRDNTEQTPHLLVLGNILHTTQDYINIPIISKIMSIHYRKNLKKFYKHTLKQLQA